MREKVREREEGREWFGLRAGIEMTINGLTLNIER